jgi:hypothetical protein
MKAIPIFGRFAENLLFSWLEQGYDVISTYVKAHQGRSRYFYY